jgi:uncharacterized protein
VIQRDPRDPGTLPGEGPPARRWAAVDLVVIGAGSLPLLLGVGMDAGRVLSRLHPFAPGSGHAALLSLISGTCAYLVVTLLVAGLLRLRHGTALGALGWVRPLPGWLLSALPVSAGLLLVSGQLTLVGHELFPGALNAQCTGLRHGYADAPLLAIPLAVLVAPVCEETLFRGFVYGWLRSRMRWSYAVVVSAVLFSAAHRSPLLALPLMAAGVVLAYVYERSRSIWPGVMVHALFNLCGVLLILTAPGCG